MKYNDLYFEDFTVGRIFETDKRTISQKEIIDFGNQFAPLPYHTDPEAAKDYMFGELVAAGFHTCSISFGLFIEASVDRIVGSLEQSILAVFDELHTGCPLKFIRRELVNPRCRNDDRGTDVILGLNLRGGREVLS